MNKICTKSKIIQVACKLFAKCGFDGTSVRDISNDADVNLASINYHFKNKQNLYCEVFKMSMDEMQEDIESIASQASSIQDFSWKLYLHFSKNPDKIKNIFKMFLSESVPLDKALEKNAEANNFGPPGFNSMMSVLNKDVGEDLPLYGRQWAVRSIFTYVSHTSLVMSTSYMKDLECKTNYLSPEAKKHSITCLVESVINYLKEHPEKFEG